ncbi:MAG: glycosyltransferase [Deltaproteobacteria bacterium]|nr:glycosyltransferase [Deltaproteobacteria bacterium]
MSTPEISVVMPAYNATAYLDKSVRSILGQTFQDFEFIIINDGSTDTTTAILKRYAELDDRIRLYDQENQGMISALNRGCRLARGRYIARMDADDVSFPRRFEKQLEYMERHPQIGILGTWIYNVDENGAVRGTWCPPTDPKILKWTNFFGVCVSHSTVLMRRQVIEKLGFYRPDAVHAEDVDLWLRACAITEFGNIPEPLSNYRVWTGSTHQRSLQLRRDTHVRLLASYIEDFLNFVPPLEAVAGLRQTRVGPPLESLRQMFRTAALVEQLYKTFVKENDLTLSERREISFDAAKKLALLGLQALRFNTRSSASLLLQALQLDYRLLRPSIMMKGLRRIWQ